MDAPQTMRHDHEAPQVYYGKNLQQSAEPPPQPASPPIKRILGLRCTTFWLLVILTAVIIAAAVGGGVRASTAVSKAKSQSACTAPGMSTSTSTTTSYFTAPTNVMLPLECNNGTKRTVAVGNKLWIFDTVCDTDRTPGDMLSIVAYSLNDCFTACAHYNEKWGNVCTAVVFASNLTDSLSRFSANCFLKNETFPASGKNGVISAVVSQ
ncbi:hypothetical protein QQS21_011929 [Conoideocrella luteorostrata]|uniref:Apple domain-containing protein n=1 Tax=Conoideocrella luteorostrata TaxID=1105319 RepID=A0AAJ0CEX1_9HYPO|nr:hypothetical protein QQS21_011929 [Conoideocrella luteorostrata]